MLLTAHAIAGLLGLLAPGEIARDGNSIILSNRFAAIRINDGGAENPSPILGIRTPSGEWTGGGRYETRTTKPVSTRAEIIETGPVRIRARVTTGFENGRRHIVTISLLEDSRAIDIEEEFDLGPDDMYRFKEYRNDRDELAWEWWSWYGDADGTKEDHPNKWVWTLTAAGFQPAAVRYRGEASTDASKGDVSQRGESGYTLTYAAPRRLEKYLTALGAWRPDGVTWYVAGSSAEPGADAIALIGHSAGLWRNPNVLPLSASITLRTSANDMRIISYAEGKRLVLECPIGLGRRAWSIRTSTLGEMLAPSGTSTSAPSAERVRHEFGPDVTREWVTDWPVSREYPRLFVDPKARDAYYARFKGKGLGMPGHTIDTFLRDQDAASFDRFYAETIAAADRMIDGYFSVGSAISNGYPGWMLGYWHGISVACALDNLAGHPLCDEDRARILREKVAILTYALVSKHSWPDKRINFGWGSMNMPVGRWGGLAVMASSIGDHPMAAAWLKDTGRYFRMLLETEYDPWGTHISCPHYIGASSTSLYAWIAMARSGLAEDVSKSPVLRNFARYYMQLMTPIDVRWGIRTLLTEGDSRPGSSSLPGILATLFRESDPDLAGQLIRIWEEGGRAMGSGMGVPDALLIDPTIPARPLKLATEVFPGFGAVIRHRALGTPEEAYLTFLAGDFMFDHQNEDQMAFEWYEKGVPLTVYMGDMYVPGAMTALTHNTIAWDVRPEGEPTPGKDKPGDWYHDKGYPWVEHVRRPRLHWEVSLDDRTQRVVDARGRTTLARELAGATLIEGKIDVKALAEVPTRPDYSMAMVQQFWPRGEPLDKPFVWTRRLLYVKAPAAAGMNYLVVRDDMEGYDGRVPSFNYWSLAESVALEARSAHFKGQLGIDTDLVVIAPDRVKLFTDSFTHDQCEPDVGAIHRARYGKPFSETQVLARVEGEKGKGFLAVIFPRKADEPRPAVEPLPDGRGVQVSWKGEVHRVILDAGDPDGTEVRKRAAALRPVDADRWPDLFVYTDTCNVYVLRDGDAAILIDLGDGGVLDHLGDIGVRTVEWVLFTHHHREQCQGAAKLGRWKPKIAAPEAERAFFERPAEFRKMKPSLGDPFTVHGSSYVRPPVEAIPIDRAFKKLDSFAWRGSEFRCVETRGNSPGGMTYLLRDGDGWIAFSGDLMIGGARMHTWFDTEWDYGFASGLYALIASVAYLQSYEPRLLLPSHGSIVREPVGELAEYERKLRALAKLYVRGYAINTFGAADQDRVSRPTRIPDVFQVTPHLFKIRQIDSWPNFGIVISESGRGLVVDCGMGRDLLDRTIEGLRREYGLKGIDACIVSHMHGDHVSDAPYLREKYGAKLWTLDSIDEVCRHPDRYDYVAHIRAYGAGFESVAFDRTFKPGETFRWEGYEFTVDWMPGQTEFGCCLHGAIDGKRIAFTGDNLFANAADPSQDGHEAVVARNSAIFEEGYIVGAGLLRRIQPDIIVAGHSYVMGEPHDLIERFHAWSLAIRDAFADLADGDYRYIFDPYWVRADPYRARVEPGKAAEIEIVVRNFHDRPQAHRISIHTPAGIAAEPPIIEGTVASGSASRFRLRLAAAPDAKEGVRIIGLDVVLDSRRYGQLFDCILIVEKAK